MSEGGTYQRILRSSALMGGAQAINYLVGLVRVKLVALLLGPAGVGVVGLYSSAMAMVGSVTDLGLQRSAVRSIAHANGCQDPAAMMRTVRMLRRLCWATGFLGWLAAAALAVPLSRMMFQNSAHASALAMLGACLLLNAINGGQMALLRGLSRIGDIARIQVTAALVNTVSTIALYAWLREHGIVPVLLVNAAVSLAISWWFVRQIDVPQGRMRWHEALAEAKPMVTLGLALMTSLVLANLLEFYTRSLISKGYGLGAAGIYQAAWSLSGLFAGFVLSAMGTDFYPRLTAVIQDRAAAAREIDQQTEIGLLLALPGLLATLAVSKWIVWALYSAKFAPAADILVWMVLGVFGRVISWPMSYVQLALNTSKWYVATEAGFIAFQGALVALLVPRIGVLGAAYAFFCCYALYFIGMAWVSHRLIGYRHAPGVRKLMLIAAGLIAASFGINRLLMDGPALAVGVLIALVGGMFCLHGLLARLGPEHRLAKMVGRVPVLPRLLGR
jgi:PST family polysaccharide transporter